MKNLVCVIGLISVLSAFSFAQGRPVIIPGSKKANSRPAATPTPTPTPIPDESTAVSQPINEASPNVTDDEVLMVETTLVSLPVQVMDRNGRFIPGLTKDNFQVFEDGKPQNIEYFGNLEQPFTVALILDMSYSTVFKTEEIQAAAIAFTAQLRPNDKVMVIAFDQEINLLCNPTVDRQISRQAIKSTKIGTGTSVYETIDFALGKLKLVTGRKAIVLFSDGVDTTSRKTVASENLRKAEESDVLIFPIQYDTYASVQEAMRQPAQISTGPSSGSSQPSSTQLPPSMQRKPISLPFPTRGQPNSRDPRDPNNRDPRDPNDPRNNPNDPRNQTDPSGVDLRNNAPIGIPTGTSIEEYRRADEYLNQLAIRTGGRLNTASSRENMALSFSRIADELRQYYTIGYYPENETDTGKTRHVKVKVNREKTVVRTKASYILGDKKTKKK